MKLMISLSYYISREHIAMLARKEMEDKHSGRRRRLERGISS